jgi:hypothetical protein
MHVLAVRHSEGSLATVPSAERTSMVRTMLPRESAMLMRDGAGEVARRLAAWVVQCLLWTVQEQIKIGQANLLAYISRYEVS